MAVNNLLSSGKIDPDDVVLLYVVGEEVGGEGMRAANELHLDPQTIIFGEPTEGKLAAGTILPVCPHRRFHRCLWSKFRSQGHSHDTN